MSGVTGSNFNIQGFTAAGFEEVEAAFRENFSTRQEVGAACAIYHRGEPVVDLWGGCRDEKSGALWEKDTLVLVFSTTKGAAAMAMALAHSRGLFELDDPISTYWPEFAQGGKSHITIRQLLAHQAGLCAIDESFTLDNLADPGCLSAALARQTPAWEPGAKHGYHGITLGWYESEIIRRTDPQGRRLRAFFQDEIARPLGLEFYIGLPAEIPDSRVASIKSYHPLQTVLHLGELPGGLVAAYMNPHSLTARAFSNPRLRRPGDFNLPEVRSLEIPSATGVGLVRSLARAYGVFATGGKELGLTAKTMQALTLPAAPPASGSFDEVLRVDSAFSMGFMKPFPGFPFGMSERAFGAPGAGGSFAFADPDAQIGFAYAPNRMGFYLWDDPREKALRDALYRCLGKLDFAHLPGQRGATHEQAARNG